MFAKIIKVEARYAAFLIALVSAVAIGSVAWGADAVPKGDNTPNSDAEIKQLAQSRQMVQEVLNHWRFKTWNQLLADDVVFNVRLGTAAKDSAGDAVLLGLRAEYTGRDAVKKALREIYGDLHKDFQITTEIARGPDVVLLGELAVTAKGKASAAAPIAVHMAFNKAGKVERIGIFSVDVRALAATLESDASKSK